MASSWLDKIRRLNQRNVATFRASPLTEISGAFGDLGTLIPLLIALAVKGKIDLASSFILSGLFNVITGIIFGIPLPVQPMKAIAAAAISSPEAPSLGTVMAAGHWVALGILILSVTGSLRLPVPVPIIKGIQIGASLQMVTGAASSLQPLLWTHPLLDNRIWALMAFLILVLTQKMPRFPYALSFFALALLLSLIQVTTSHQSLPSFDSWRPKFVFPIWSNYRGDALWMAIGQLPLTTLNSIMAVNALANDLFPELPTPSLTSIGLSVALMNLTGTWFGALPVCHGSGGLAAQYRFGARSGASVIFLGVLKILLGYFFGRTLLDLLANYPKSLLGVMVLASGLELAKVGYTLNDDVRSDDERQERWNIMIITTACIVAFKNDAIGFLAGITCYGSYRISDRLMHRDFAAQDERSPLLQ